jgi:long-subunit acyl-CoA synthetase (AMP-forming)
MKFEGMLARAARFVSSTLSVRSGAGNAPVHSFPEFVADVRALQESLRAAGVVPGQLVGLQAAGSYEFVVWDVALIDMGAVPHVFPEDWSPAQIQAAAESRGLAHQVSAQDGSLPLRGAAPAEFLCGQLHSQNGAPLVADGDLLTHVYSSGTTGKFKGLKISRRGAEDIAEQFQDSFQVDHTDRYLFFLPFSHFQQRHSVYLCLYCGISMHWTPYARVFHDLRRFQPTFLIGPPSFYETAIATLVPPSAPSHDREALARGFGGKIRFMITGMAPIRRSVLDGFRDHGVNLLEAYGLTEIGLVAWNVPDDNAIGTVGRPLRTNRITFSAESEILVEPRFPMSTGYFTDDTDEVVNTFLGNGIIATGDIGEFSGSHLVLRGRKKDIIVTRGGVKFHPADMESRLLTVAIVRQAVVFTDLQSSDVVAVIVVDEPDSQVTMQTLKVAIAAINNEVRAYMRISSTILTGERFTPDNQMMTRNLKPNRSAIARHYSSNQQRSP